MVPTILAAVGVADPPEIAVDVQADDLPATRCVAIQAALIVGADPIGAIRPPSLRRTSDRTDRA